MLDADPADDAGLLDAVRRLRPQQQECVVLRFLLGFSVMETAQAMNIGERTVAVLQYLAADALPRQRPAVPDYVPAEWSGEPNRTAGIALRWPVLHRNRSARLAQLLDEAAGSKRRRTWTKFDDSLTDLVTVGQRLSQLPVKVEAQQEFRVGLRAMLLATAEREGIGVTVKEPEPTSRAPLRSLRRPAGSGPAVSRRTRSRGAIVVGLAAGTLALSGMSAASGDAIPGDALYSVKRST
ncbi:sigma factor-like helix-turn-helix DNA-binding protein, partial [Dactylosporangium sucinum]|uniref:sigma factor-like helix-turn-helix DNA-binding protein n=1 Tax=Dactylosporangium sucinum TaxID=1424081 RepID=UPI0035712793